MQSSSGKAWHDGSNMGPGSWAGYGNDSPIAKGIGKPEELGSHRMSSWETWTWHQSEVAKG